MGRTPPATTKFTALAMANVTPAAFEATWEASMEEWGIQIKAAVEGATRMLGEGLGVGSDALLHAGRYGPHLLAPTATDLKKYDVEGESEFLFCYDRDLSF